MSHSQAKESVLWLVPLSEAPKCSSRTSPTVRDLSQGIAGVVGVQPCSFGKFPSKLLVINDGLAEQGPGCDAQLDFGLSKVFVHTPLGFVRLHKPTRQGRLCGAW